MFQIFNGLASLAFLALVAGLIRPSIYDPVFKRKTTRGFAALIFGGALLVLSMAAAVTEPQSLKDARNKADEEQRQSEVKRKKELEAKGEAEAKQKEAQAKQKAQVEQKQKEEAAAVAKNIVVTSTIVKKVDGKFRYFFDVHNKNQQPASATVTITLLPHDTKSAFKYPFDIELEALAANLHKPGYATLSTGNTPEFGSDGIARFSYKVTIGSHSFPYDPQPITHMYEDYSGL